MYESRLHKSLLNARVNTIFYFITLFLSFFSRKIFLEKLGDDFVGLTGTISNLLDFLNLAELGIGAAIGAVLYKPLFINDRSSINEIISVFGYFYRKIGLIILTAGVLLSCFLPLIFIDTTFSLSLIYYVYLSFLATTLIGYFANYKQTLLGADQRNYVVTAYFQTSNLVKALIQMALAYYTQNYFYWVTIELIFGVVYSIILNWKIRQVYPWLDSEVKSGKALKDKYPLVMTYSKQLFVHKIGTLVQFQIKPLLIYGFVSLKIVAYYGNYALIVDKLSLLVNNVLGSTGAGVGSLIAENDNKKIKQVFWELTSLRYFIAGVLVFSVYYLINPFITLWIGSGYILNNTVLILILCNMYIAQTRGTNDQFMYGYGLFNDLWAPITEAAISILVSFIAGYYWELEGVLSGSVVSMFLIIVLWKPYFLFRDGFKDKVYLYWKEIIKYILLFALTWFCIRMLILKLAFESPDHGYLAWFIFASITVSMFSLVYATLMYFFSIGFRYLIQRILRKIFAR